MDTIIGVTYMNSKKNVLLATVIIPPMDCTFDVQHLDKDSNNGISFCVQIIQK